MVHSVTLQEFMDKAEILVRKYAKPNQNLKVWRCERSHRKDPKRGQFDTILAGVPDENRPQEPSELIVFIVQEDLDNYVFIGHDSGSMYGPIEEVASLISYLREHIQKLPNL